MRRAKKVAGISHHALRAECDKAPGASEFLRPRYLFAYCFLAAPLLALLNLWVLQPDGVRPADRFLGLAAMAVGTLYIESLPLLRGRFPNPRNRLVQPTLRAPCSSPLVCSD